MTTENQRHIREANAKYAEAFDPAALKQIAPGPEPVGQCLILTCMDARIDPPSAFGIPLGAAHIIRNAGASARDALRSIIISQQVMHTREIIVIKHTDCGLERLPPSSLCNTASSNNNTNNNNGTAHPQGNKNIVPIRSLLLKNLGPTAAREAAGLNFEGFQDVVAATKEDVEFLRKCACIPDDVPLSGWVYETEVGRVRKVV